jgi:hypothetical protein
MPDATKEPIDAEVTRLKSCIDEQSATCARQEARIAELEPLARMGQAFAVAMEVSQAVHETEKADPSLTRTDAFIRAWQEMKAARDEARADIDRQNETIRTMGERCEVLTNMLRKWLTLNLNGPSIDLIEETERVLARFDLAARHNR